MAVVQKLQSRLGSNVYTLDNVMISGTHTHSGPGGYSTATLYDLTSFGFSQQNFDVIVNGLAESIVRAHQNRAPSSLKVTEGTLLNANINRSPYSYTYNKDADEYEYNVPKEMTLLSIERNNKPVSMVAWMSVHGTSLNNTNRLVSGDNKGYASWYVERKLNDPDALPGNGDFVAAFAQVNEGDVSPNTKGPHCPDGSPCNEIHSTCNGSVEFCIAPGPGEDMYDSCQIIGEHQLNEALGLLHNPANQSIVSGAIGYRHTYVDFGSIAVAPEYSSTGKAETTCMGALGCSFAAGTIDGPGQPPFVQGMNYSITPDMGILYTLVSLTHMLNEPTEEQIACQAPKPIFLNVGGIEFPGHSQWAASVLPLQIFRVGQLWLVGVPGEFTTMSGRRLQKQVLRTLVAAGEDPDKTVVVIAGLSNEYTHYIATPEEYQVQRYEAASTLFGPQTLPAYLQEFTAIAKALVTNSTLPPSQPVPVYNFTSKLFPVWPGDTHPPLKPYGSVIDQVKSNYAPGETASVSFVGAMPNNNLRTNGTYLSVEMKNAEGDFDVVLVDSDWETVFHWNRPSELLHHSQITIDWNISPGTPSGAYRIRYFGDAKDKDTKALTPFIGTSATFTVSSSSLSSHSLDPSLFSTPRAWFRANTLPK